MKILAFDTSNKALSIAILEDSYLLASMTLNIKKNHSISLMPSIDFLMHSINLLPKDIDRIAVAQGPGSYTGLRIAVATAKTLAYSLGIDLVGVSSLFSLAAGIDFDGLIIPIIDARRQNVYAGIYKNKELIQAEKHISFEKLLNQLPSDEKIMFVGEVEAFEELIDKHLSNATYQVTLPDAYQLGKQSLKMAPVNVDAFVPNYLKRVEAEEHWLEKNKESNPDNYIKRV